MGPTLLDIARETKTSVSTVSRVLSGSPVAMRISKETRQRVHQVAERVGYRPNLLARSLRTRRTNTVALLISDIANPYFARMGSLIEQQLHQEGYSLILCNSGEDPAREAEYLTLLPQKGIDGLILVPIQGGRKSLVARVAAHTPMVVLDRPVQSGPPAVASDQDILTNLLCDELLRVGIDRAGLVSGPTHIVTHHRRAQIFAQRLQIIAEHQGPARVATGQQAYQKMQPLNPPAIVCTNNMLAEGVLSAMNHLDNPPVIALIDEIPMTNLLSVPILMSLQDVEGMARACVQQLLKQIAGEGGKRQTQLLPSRLQSNAAYDARFPRPS